VLKPFEVSLCSNIGMVDSPKKYVLAIDQGTTSSRAVIFSTEGDLKAVSQNEFEQIYPHPGWAEHDPMEILASVEEAISEAMSSAGISASEVAAIGIANQRETTVAWDSKTGKPLHNALVWLDVRTEHIVERLKAKSGQDHYRHNTGLPISTYFSAVKMMWLMENCKEVSEAVEEGRCMFGTIDCWLIYNLTGGSSGGAFVTDVTNASRYMLMDLNTLTWDAAICKDLGIPISCLPEIRSNCEEFGIVKSGPLAGVPITGSIGDQHSALLGQACISVGDVKSTYGTGCFIVMNTGKELVPSFTGLLTTTGYKLGKDSPIVYALEGSVATAGRGVQWLRDSLQVISKSSDVGPLAAQVENTGGVTLVPAFSGLLAPYWRPDARGALVGISLHTTKAHIARAMLEGVAFQACDVFTAMEKDATTTLNTLKVDGGMSVSNEAMQIQSDLLGKPLLRAKMPEATALGAAFAAGLAVGIWNDPADIHAILERSGGATAFQPSLGKDACEAAHKRWKDAVQRSYDLAGFAEEQEKTNTTVSS